MPIMTLGKQSSKAEDEHSHGLFGGLIWMPCIAVSVTYIVITMFLAEAARKSVKAVLPNNGGRGRATKLIKLALLEFVAAAEMCGCGFELIIGNSLHIFNIKSYFERFINIGKYVLYVRIR